ncbi:MAG: GDP-mannose 4,6-dehydratase [Actinomycetota bacterium]|nr:GDP-mannose 4,6-dehydratase [Actinomycetota bacterium]
MRALVTGASGFVGLHLVGHLEAAGDRVTAGDRRAGGPDLLDPTALRDWVGANHPDVVYHLAAFSSVAESWDDPAATFRTNAEGTLNLLLACRDAGVGRVVCIGSADVYGKVAPDELPVDETTPMRPHSPYAASKAAAEQAAVWAGYGLGLDVIRVRAFNHLGPGQSPRFVAAALAHRVAHNELTDGSVVTVGNLDARRDFTDVRDVVRAYRLLAEAGTAGEVYNVASGVDRAVRDLAEHYLARANRPMSLEIDPELFRPVDVPVVRGDASKLRAATGWVPEVPFDQTLDDLLDDARLTARSAVA